MIDASQCLLLANALAWFVNRAEEEAKLVPEWSGKPRLLRGRELARKRRGVAPPNSAPTSSRAVPDAHQNGTARSEQLHDPVHGDGERHQHRDNAHRGLGIVAGQPWHDDAVSLMEVEIRDGRTGRQDSLQ